GLWGAGQDRVASAIFPVTKPLYLGFSQTGSGMKSLFPASLLLCLCGFGATAQESSPPHNVIIFVGDGLRYGSVEPGNMPNMARLKHDGVDFTNSHSLYPTVTTVN